jgi:DNA-binding LacI/PurR family transcriptional regulator
LEREAIEERQYRPSRAAASLSSGTTRSIVVIVPLVLVTSPPSVARLSGVISVLDQGGYDCAVCNVETLEQRDRQLEQLLRARRADGVIVASLPLERAKVQSLRHTHVPPVMVDADTPGVSRTDVDDVLGGRLACQFLLARGHARIAFQCRLAAVCADRRRAPQAH